jgi:GTP-binding protein
MAKPPLIVKSVQKMQPTYKGKPRPAVAVAGRSNVGKSTLINALLERKVVPTSKQPGRTRKVQRLLINDYWDLVDLPGYGFAKVGEEMRVKWRSMVSDFLSGHGNLRCVFVLVDVRRGLNELDHEMIQWCIEERVRVAIALTKADKLGRGKLKEIERKVQHEVGSVIDVYPVSAMKRQGIRELQQAIVSWISEGDG